MVYHPIMMKYHKKRKQIESFKKIKQHVEHHETKPMEKQLNYIVTNIRSATKLAFLPFSFMDVSEAVL